MKELQYISKNYIPNAYSLYRIFVYTLFALPFLSGCNEDSIGLHFSHSSHKQYVAVCQDCHTVIEDEEIERASHKQCFSCHPEVTKEKDTNACLKCHVSMEQMPQPLPRANYSNVPPEHGIHEEEGIACSVCHGDVDNIGKIVGIDFMRMEGCLACHFPNKTKDDLVMECFFCHLDMNRKRILPSHTDGMWRLQHGATSQREPFLCSRCHTQDSCDQCHMLQPPQTHTNVFKKRGHGLQASSLPNRCQVCHKQDFCLNCHQQKQPTYHTRSFKRGKPYSHCGWCHFPLEQGNRCRACHVTADHNEARAQAPSPPPFVDKSLPCFTCHPIDLVPIPHLYNTIPDTECIFCH